MTVDAASKDANLYVLDVYACDRTSFNQEMHKGEGQENDDTLSASSDVEVSEVDFIAS